jgi:uncharacterized alkaline shock family protein YloU
LILNKVDKAKFKRSQEFRRHVTMTADVDKQDIDINIDIITDYFEKIKEFTIAVEKLVLEIPQQ